MFSETAWECRLVLTNLKDRIDWLQFELEPCEYLEPRSCIISSKDQEYPLNKFTLKKASKDWAICSLKKGEIYYVDFTFLVKKQEPGAERRETFDFEYFLKVNYLDKEGNSPQLPDLCPKFTIMIYTPLDFLLNHLLHYLKDYIDDTLLFGQITGRFNNELGIELSEEVLHKLLEFLKNNGVIDYKIESSDEFKLTDHRKTGDLLKQDLIKKS